MNINMSDFLKGNIASQTSGASTSSAADVLRKIVNGNGQTTVNTDNVKLLSQLMTGDTFTGFVSQVKDGAVTIMLNNGQQLNAQLAEGASIGVGGNVTFMVENNNGTQVSIKPVPAAQQQAVLIDKVLDAAGLAPSDENVNVVKELLNLGMSVDSDTVSQLARYSSNFPDANINTIANLMRLEIPVTQDNIREFEMYGQFNGQIEDLLSEMETGIADSIAQSFDNPEALQTFRNVVSTLYEGLEGNQVQSSLTENVLSNETLTEFSNMLKDAGVSPETTGDIGKTSVKDLLTKLLTEDSGIDTPEKFKEVVDSKGFKELLHAAVNDTMKLTPKDVAEGETAVSTYYKRVKKNVENIENSLKTGDAPAGQELSKSLSDIKSNIDFMNDLNKNMTYIQMPIKFSESEGNGELYVFTNKRNLAGKTDNISAMLHLDMENLKSLDIYVNLTGGNNISTNFVLESEELLDFVYSHIDTLNTRLEQLGYKTHFEMKTAEPEERLDFVKDFIEKDVRPASGGQYMFDVKA